MGVSKPDRMLWLSDMLNPWLIFSLVRCLGDSITMTLGTGARVHNVPS